MLRAGLVIVALSCCVSQTWGSEVRLTGDALVVKSQRLRLQGSASDALPGALDDPTLRGGDLQVFDIGGGSLARFELPPQVPPLGWRGLGNPPGAKGYRYRGAGSAGDPCKKVVVTATRISASCVGAGVALPVLYGGDRGVILSLGQRRYCAAYGGEVRGNPQRVYMRADAAAPLACPEPVAGPIVFDASATAQPVLGFGAHVWAGDSAVPPVLAALDIDYLRLSVGPNWSQLEAAMPSAASAAEMDEYVAQNFNGDFPSRLADAQSAWATAQSLDAKIVLLNWEAPAHWEDGTGTLRVEHLDDYARFWGSLLVFLDTHGMRPALIELANEPEGNWNSRIPPPDYAALLRATRDEIDQRGVADVGILGPGLAYMTRGAEEWSGALDPSLLAGWSTHAWDEAFAPTTSAYFVQLMWDRFLAALRPADPGLSKPIFITEYSSAVTTFDGVAYGAVADGGAASASETTAFAVRVFANTLTHVNNGAGVAFVWQGADQDWDPAAWGLIRSPAQGSTPRLLYDALATLLPVVPEGALALHPQGDLGGLQATGFVAASTLVLALANTSAVTITRRIELLEAPQAQLSSATAFANGVVTAVDASLDPGPPPSIDISLPPQSTLTLRFTLSPG